MEKALPKSIDEVIETTIDERFSLSEKRAFRYSLDIPDEALHKIVREAQSSLATGKKIQYRRVEQMTI